MGRGDGEVMLVLPPPHGSKIPGHGCPGMQAGNGAGWERRGWADGAPGDGSCRS